MTDRPDPYRSVSRGVLTLLADEGRPMSLRDLQADGRLAPSEAARQLSVARVAGFVRTMPGLAEGLLEPCYAPTALGMQIARRSRAFAAAQRERAVAPARPLPVPPRRAA